MPIRFNPLPWRFDRIGDSTPGSDIETLTGDSGGAVGPDASQNVNILGNPDINIAGNPGTNTLQATDLTKLTPFVVDQSETAGTEVAYSTIQSAMDAANTKFIATGIPQVVYVRPGDYVENLTFYNGVDLKGTIGQVDSAFLTVTGLHTLPANGDMATYGIWYKGTTACFTGAPGGTCKVNMFNVITEISGTGYTFDIDGYSGEINIFDYLQFDGGNNGFVYNPTGGCEVNIIFAGVGLTQNTSATAVISGNSFFQGMLVSINMNFVGTSSTQLNMGCELQGTISTSDSASVDIANTYFYLGSTKAITHNSSGTVTLSNVGINSSATEIIDGSGSGLLFMESCAFINSRQIGPSVITPNLSHTIVGSGQTINTGTADLITYELRDVKAVYQFVAQLSGISASGAGAGVRLIGTIKTDGAAASIVDTVDDVTNTDLVLASASATVVASGNNLVVRATGALGAIINWNCTLTFKQITL